MNEQEKYLGKYVWNNISGKSAETSKNKGKFKMNVEFGEKK